MPPKTKTIASRFNQLKSHPRWVRIPLGILLIVGGIFGALPILGFWMLPLGLILLSADFPWAKRILAYFKLMLRRARNRYRQHFGKKPLPIDGSKGKTTAVDEGGKSGARPASAALTASTVENGVKPPNPPSV